MGILEQPLIAHNKINDTIQSCITLEQLESAETMVDTFHEQYLYNGEGNRTVEEWYHIMILGVARKRQSLKNKL